MLDSEAATLARIDQKVIGIENWQAQHTKEDDSREFGHVNRNDKMLTAVKEGFDKIDNRFDKIETKIATLWDDKNKASGVLGFSKIAGMGIWALIIIGINYFISGKHT